MQGLKPKSDLGVFVLAVTLALVGGVFVSGIMMTSRTLPSSGSIKAINVGVYWDFDCTQNVTVIDWGIPGPGDVVYRTVFVKNSGNSGLALNMSCSGWNPVLAEGFLTLSWDVEGVVVQGGEVVQAVFALDVSEAVTGVTDFSFNIVLEGIG